MAPLMTTLLFQLQRHTVILMISVFSLFGVGNQILEGADPDAIANFGSGTDTFGCVSGIQAYSFHGGLCNIGDAPLPGDVEGDHAVWTANVYRLHSNRFEQIGLSWVKHDDWTIDVGDCISCPVGECENETFDLDPGCRDTYIACQNGIQAALGPRSQINP